MRKLLKNSFSFSTIPKWATIDPWSWSGSKPHTVTNILDGKTIVGEKT